MGAGVASRASLHDDTPLSMLSEVSEAADSPLEETPDTALAQHKVAPSRHSKRIYFQSFAKALE